MVSDQLRRNGRSVDPNFEPNEELYHACNKNMLSGDPVRISTDAIGFDHNALSVNRGKHSEPDDVLSDPNRTGFGVVSWKVSDVPTEEWTPGNRNAATYQLKVEHMPKEDNYSHTEVQIRKNGSFDRNTKIKAKTYMQKIRQKLSDASKVLIEPTA